MRHDPLADFFSSLKNAERAGKKEVIFAYSKLITKILDVMQKYGYIKGYEVIKRKNYREVLIKLANAINECNVIKPRHSFKYEELLKFKRRYLPAIDFGILIVSTSQGVMSDRELEEKKIGGVLLGYVF